MATTNYCNVDIANPVANPKAPKGIQTIPAGATQQQMIQIINNNFQNLVRGNFVEDKARRVTKITRFFDPDNDSNYIDVRETVGSIWVNNITGQTVTWRR